MEPCMYICNIQSQSKGHFFDRDTMRFFRSRILSDACPLHAETGFYLFVTSEKSPYSARSYTIRAFNPATRSITTFTVDGKTQTFLTARAAKARLKHLTGWEYSL